MTAATQARNARRWRCPACKLRNSKRRARCAACGHRRQVPA